MSHLFTKEQFLDEFERVIEAFGEDHWPDSRVQLVFEHLHGVDLAWLKARIDEVILAWDQKFNWVESAKAERVRRDNRELKRLEEQAFQYGHGLENILKGFGANSLAEVIEKQAKTKKEPMEVYRKVYRFRDPIGENNDPDGAA